MVAELATAGVPVMITCRVLGMSTSGYFEWRDRGPSARARADAELTATIIAIHIASRGTYARGDRAHLKCADSGDYRQLCIAGVGSGR